MKNIKVFIASSAELDDDKTQVDLYFSQKNKAYVKRYIFFEQKTWKDFPSNLSVENLQKRYDDYIQECDIVIFLFHTRLGQYTLRELEVAFGQLKASKGKKPLIYIYGKRDEKGKELLDKLKQYSEQEYGHFCDTYSDYNELFRHFDYQLAQLENNGFIRPAPVDVPRTLRFVLLCLLPVCLVALFLLAYQLSRPENFRVQLTEQIRAALPFQGGTITLQYADIKEERTIENLEEPITFKGINRWHCWFGDFTLRFESKGFLPVDTTFRFTEQLTLPIQRNGRAGHLMGIVTHEDRSPVVGAQVRVLGLHAETAADGTFEIQIPLEQQALHYRLTITKVGYEAWDYSEVAPSENDYIRIILRK